MRSLIRSVLLCLLVGTSFPQQGFGAKEVSPQDCYLSFLTAVYYAKDLAAVAQYFPKAQRDAFKKMSPQQQQQKLTEYKGHYISKPKFLSQKIDGTNAHLTLTGAALAGDKAFMADVQVDMIKEDGYWRILTSSYSGNVQL